MSLKSLLTTALLATAILAVPKIAIAQESRITATFYRDDQIVVDDHNATFEVISNSQGNPSLGDTVRVVRWSDGTISTILQIRGETYLNSHPAQAYGVGPIGGRIYEAYCAESEINEMLCYSFSN